MATIFQTQTAKPQPDWMPLSPEPQAGLCVVCGQEAVAVDPLGFGWCNAHAPLELLCP
jgi:hypothetical protein